MRTIKIIVHVYNKLNSGVTHNYIRCERVAQNGTSQETFQAYEPYKDEEVQLSLVYVDWHTGQKVPSLYIDRAWLRKGLEKINLFPLEF